MSDKDLLEFYKKQFEEEQKKDDRFKEKVDQHLKQLIAERHELESEVSRRGDKISDLQKALVELQLNCFAESEKFINVSAENKKLKRNEEKLHEHIRNLLNDTQDKALRDKIIYILEDSHVAIGYRGDNLKGLNLKKSDEVLKKEIEALHAKLNEHSKVAQNKSDIILEDCKVALERSKEKLIRNEEEIAFLHAKLEEFEGTLSKLQKKCYKDQENFDRDSVPQSRKFVNEIRSHSDPKLGNENSKPNKSLEGLQSTATEIHLSSVLLSKILTKILSILEKIQMSAAFADFAKISKATAIGKEYVSGSDVEQLQSYIRQSTRLSFEISNLWKLLDKAFSSKDTKNELLSMNMDIHWELKELESAVEELRVVTAEADLQCISLQRSTFLDSLTRPKQAFEKFGVKETRNQSKYVSDFNKMETNLKSALTFISQAVKFADRIVQKCRTKDSGNQLQSGIYQTTPHLSKSSEFISESQRAENANLDSFASCKTDVFPKEKFSKSDEFSNYKPNNLRKHLEGRRSSSEELTRRINKTLSKINHLEKGEYSKDNEFCKNLAGQVGSLTEKLRELYEEFNVRSVQDQFSEYSALTLSKLETLAKQSRDAVISAEAQITVHRDNSRLLSQKLKDTEELLRESIHECLVLKQKLRLQELHSETEKAELSKDLKEKLHRVSDFDDLETAVKEVASTMEPQKGSKKPSAPFECMYCKQGSGHKLCEEKIKELRANNRKLTTELKLLQQDMKEEKKIARMSQEELNRANRENATQSQTWKGTCHSLEAKNSAIAEQLKLEKNRLRNMERFRRLEIEGFQTDIKNLKTKIQGLEKQLMNAVLIFEHNKKDEELLQTIHSTAQRTKQATAAIKRLKAELYGIETDIKHL